MLLAIDIGNSLIKFGIFDGAVLFHKFSIQTKRDYTVEELFFDRLRMIDERVVRVHIHTVVVSSVVPELDETCRKFCKELFKVTPVFVDSTFDFGLKINYEPVTSVGADRLINASAAVAKYGKPAIVCSFGTATTIDTVNSKSEFLGGIIAPGMGTMAESLHLKTAKLPQVQIAKPEHLIGNSTESSIQSGTFNGYIALVEGLIVRFLQEASTDGSGISPKVVGTGGFVRVIAQECNLIEIVDENLTLDGLRLLAKNLL